MYYDVTDISRLAPIKELLGNQISYGQLRIIRQYIIKMYGMNVVEQNNTKNNQPQLVYNFIKNIKFHIPFLNFCFIQVNLLKSL